MEESDVALQQEYSEEKSLVLSPDTSSSSTCSGLEIEFIRDIDAHECADANLVSCPPTTKRSRARGTCCTLLYDSVCILFTNVCFSVFFPIFYLNMIVR